MKKKLIFRQLLVMLLIFLGVAGKSQSPRVHYIKVTDFKVAKVDNEVEISWATDKSVATNYFEVEKSSDDEEFKTVAVVMGPDPTKTGCDCYWCVDKITTNSKGIYYRLKHVDVNGLVEFSAIKFLTLR